MSNIKLRSSAARAAHRLAVGEPVQSSQPVVGGGASPRFARPFYIVGSALLLLSACTEINPTSDSQYSYGQKPIENKVGKNGELISPDCKRWTASPITNSSNERQSHIGCSVVTNLGLMLENPSDLERGASGGKVSPDNERNSLVIQKYRSGIAPATEATTSPSTGQ